MKSMKYALAALAAAGLTAGSVLAFAEPTASSLPQAIPAAGACPACPGKTCGTAKCTAAVSACAGKGETAACAAEKTACGEQKCGRLAVGAKVNSNSGVVGVVTEVEETREGIGGPVGPGFGTQIVPGAPRTAEVAAEDSGCPDGKCESKKKGRISLHLGIGTDGPIFRLTSAEEPAAAGETCPNGACSAAAKCEDGACTAAACEQACGKAKAVAATACEAKPACVASACSGAACPASACPNATCAESACAACPHANGGVAAVEADEADGACNCEDCCCEKCDCADEGCPPAPARLEAPLPAVARVRHGAYATGMRYMILRGSPAECGGSDDASPGDVLRNYNSYQHDRVYLRDGFAGQLPSSVFRSESVPGPPGRVRLTHFPDLGFLAMPPGFVPPTNLQFTSFATPVVAPEPPAVLSTSRRNPAEGCWTRTLGGVTTTVACRDGRIDGTVRIEGRDEPALRFSGLCSVSKDGLLYGVVETAEADPGRGIDDAVATLGMLDQPFSIRFTTDNGSLIVKDLRCAGLSSAAEGTEQADLLKRVLVVACGRYARAAE